jgi:hypothetical protein
MPYGRAAQPLNETRLRVNQSISAYESYRQIASLYFVLFQDY